jgi:hypothetical protein
LKTLIGLHIGRTREKEGAEERIEDVVGYHDTPVS